MTPDIRSLATEAGVSAEALKKWSQRGAVPHKWRLRLIEDGKKRRIKLTPDDMEWAAAKSKRRKAA